MKVYIPPDADEPFDLGMSTMDAIDSLRLSEAEILEDMITGDDMANLLSGKVSFKTMRPVLWLILKRDHKELELAGFDVSFDDDVEEDPDSGKD